MNYLIFDNIEEIFTSIDFTSFTNFEMFICTLLFNLMFYIILFIFISILFRIIVRLVK